MVCANVRACLCVCACVYMCVYGRYMYICASKRPIDSARWLLHFNNSHIDGLRFIYGVYFVFADRWSSILGSAVRFENHQRFVDAVLKCVWLYSKENSHGWPRRKIDRDECQPIMLEEWWRSRKMIKRARARANPRESLRVARERRDVESWLG